MHQRRWATVLAARSDSEGKRAVALARLGERAQLAGTALPPSFPHRLAVIAAGYPCLEDLPDLSTDPDPPGAREALAEELTRHGLSPRAAADVIRYL